MNNNTWKCLIGQSVVSNYQGKEYILIVSMDSCTKELIFVDYNSPECVYKSLSEASMKITSGKSNKLFYKDANNKKKFMKSENYQKCTKGSRTRFDKVTLDIIYAYEHLFDYAYKKCMHSLTLNPNASKKIMISKEDVYPQFESNTTFYDDYLSFFIVHNWMSVHPKKESVFVFNIRPIKYDGEDSTVTRYCYIK